MARNMNFATAVFVCCYILTVSTYQVAVADTEDKSEEVGANQEIKSAAHNESSSAEAGPPDSHEAMNNREINPKARDKRSYEFLMGLVNNNSKYEVTRVDPAVKTEQALQDDASNVTASELLLELMVKIAAHPNHWEKVHKLLQKIDSDLLESKKLVEDLETAQIKVEPKHEEISVNKKDEERPKNKTNDHFSTNQWPSFEEDKVSFVNTVPPENYRWQSGQLKSTYPKTFAYHRVTGRPLYLNKNPKAYIAVSVIAPKPINSRSKDEDLSLEKELRQLKPWTHNQNLKNMASIRSRWVIQTDEDKKEAVAP